MIEANGKPDSERVSHTAVFCAKRLSEESDVTYARELYRELCKYDHNIVKDGNKFGVNLLHNLMFMLPSIQGLRAILEGRYVGINEALAKEGNPYVMEIASGLSPRGLALTRKDPDLLFIETDLPALHSIKKEIANNIRIDEWQRRMPLTPKYHLIDVDATNRNEMMQAAQIYAGSDRKRPLAIVNTGLLPYLDSEEQIKVRDNIKEILTTYSPNGMWITSDFSLGKTNLLSNFFIKMRMRALEKKTGRKFSFFKDQEEIDNFLGDAGFGYSVLKGSDLIDKLSFVKKIGIGREKVLEKSVMYDTYIAKLK